MLPRGLSTIAKRFSTTRVGFIGAGGVNFGGAEGPWDHSSRLEYFGNSNAFDIEVVGIADTNIDTAKSVIDRKNTQYKNAHKNIYEKCQPFNNWIDMINADDLNLNAVIIGTPPSSRGSSQRGYNMELQCIRKGLDLLVEKPLSNESGPDFLRYAIELNEEQSTTKSKRFETRNPIICVGYMFRYHSAIQKMKEILGDRDIFHLNVRYQCAYPEISKQFWWDQAQSGGPIVEQCTHFVDLTRYFCGECDLETLNSNAVYYGDKGLKMMNEEVNVGQIKKGMVNQIITCSNWKTDRGVVVGMSHGIHLHGQRYETYIDLWADGLTMTLSNPYDDVCHLRVRDVLDEKEEKDNGSITAWGSDEKNHTFMRVDPYKEQMKCFLTSIGGQRNEDQIIMSDYNDAAYTYILTRDIQNDVMDRAPPSKLKWR